MPRVPEFIANGKLSPTANIGGSGGTPVATNLLLQESGGTNAFLLEDSSGVIILES